MKKRRIIVDGVELPYLISDEGEVFSELTGKWLQGSVNDGGYRQFSLKIDKKLKCFMAHRLVAEAFIEKTPLQQNERGFLTVNHKDGNKLNNTVKNLEWATMSQNALHAYENGLIKREKDNLYYYGDLEQEIWKPFLDSNYQASSKGRVMNSDTKRILKGKKQGDYIRYELRLRGERKTLLGHRIVYKAFHPEVFDIFDTEMFISHKNKNHSDNSIDNLEMLTRNEHANKNYAQKRNGKGIPVKQYSSSGDLVQTFRSLREASLKTGLGDGPIRTACIKQSEWGGFHWRFLEDDF